MLPCAAIRASAARLRTRSRRLTIVLCPSTQDCLDDSTVVCVGQPRWLTAVSFNQKTLQRMSLSGGRDKDQDLVSSIFMIFAGNILGEQ